MNGGDVEEEVDGDIGVLEADVVDDGTRRPWRSRLRSSA